MAGSVSDRIAEPCAWLQIPGFSVTSSLELDATNLPLRSSQMANNNVQDLKDAETIVTEVMKTFDDALIGELRGGWVDEAERLKWRKFLLAKTYFNLNQGKKDFKKHWTDDAPRRQIVNSTATAHAVYAGQTIKADRRDKATFVDVITALDAAKAKCLLAFNIKSDLVEAGFVCDL